MFFSKPTGGPDSVGGLFPVDFPSVKCRNRSATTHVKGDVVQLPFPSGVAAEIATNDSNSYKPGHSNDTVWNTVVDPTATVIQQGGFIGVCVSASVADNAIGEYQFYGIIEQAFTIKATGNLTSGDPLTVATAGSFDGVVLSNECVFASYLDVEQTNSTRSVLRVFLHNGMFPTPAGTVPLA
jgi:hypothetical protein